MRQLRDPETGCPWDLEQTFATIAPYTIEEAYEVEDAIRREAWADLCDELGDLLLQVVYHAQMAEEAGHFGFDDVVGAICAKLVRRHPHVFGDARRPSPEQAVGVWEQLKASERAERSRGPFDGIPETLPALMRASKLWQRAQSCGLADEPEPRRLEQLGQGGGELSLDRLGAWMALCAREMTRLGGDPEAWLREENAREEARLRARAQAAGGADAPSRPSSEGEDER